MIDALGGHVSEQQTIETLRFATSFHAGLFAWPSLHRDLLRACAASGVTRRTVRTRWRGLTVQVELELEGEAERVRRLRRFVDDLVAQAARA